MKLWMAFPIALTLVLANGRAATAQSQADLMACQQDIVQTCAKNQSAGAPSGVMACLVQHKDKLKPECRKIIDKAS